MAHLTGSASDGNLISSSGSSSAYMEAVDFTALLHRLNLPSDVNRLMMDWLQNAFNLIWNCGVQTLLLIAGLQTIPNHLYEVSRVEGATAWETFWYVTIPMLGRVIMLVIFYTMVELFVRDNYTMDQAVSYMSDRQIYDVSSAMIWFYFAIAGAVMGLVILVYNRVCLRKWE
jgi:ABC-type sugar transport system permease subunit